MKPFSYGSSDWCLWLRCFSAGCLDMPTRDSQAKA
jgi:hypothetical protein